MLSKFSFQVTAAYSPPTTNLELNISEIELYLLNLTKIDIILFMGDFNINILNTADILVNKYLCMRIYYVGFFLALLN